MLLCFQTPARSKREIKIKNIPEAPRLPQLNYDALPEFVRKLISTPKPEILTHLKDYEEPGDFSAEDFKEELEHKIDEMIAEAMPDDDSDEGDNDEDDLETEDDEEFIRVPRTYGMNLTMDRGYVWNDLWSKPGMSFDIGDLESVQEKEEDKKEITPDIPNYSDIESVGHIPHPAESRPIIVEGNHDIEDTKDEETNKHTESHDNLVNHHDLDDIEIPKTLKSVQIDDEKDYLELKHEEKHDDKIKLEENKDLTNEKASFEESVEKQPDNKKHLKKNLSRNYKTESPLASEPHKDVSKQNAEGDNSNKDEEMTKKVTVPVEKADPFKDLLNNEEFWKWFGDWTSTYLELLMKKEHGLGGAGRCISEARPSGSASDCTPCVEEILGGEVVVLTLGSWSTRFIIACLNGPAGSTSVVESLRLPRLSGSPKLLKSPKSHSPLGCHIKNYVHEEVSRQIKAYEAMRNTLVEGKKELTDEKPKETEHKRKPIHKKEKKAKEKEMDKPKQEEFNKGNQKNITKNADIDKKEQTVADDKIIIDGKEIPITHNTNFEIDDVKERENDLKHRKDKKDHKATTFNPHKGKPADEKPKPNSPIHVSATNIFGNSAGNDKVTNVFIFYPSDDEDSYEIDDDLKPYINDSDNIFAFGGNEKIDKRKEPQIIGQKDDATMTEHNNITTTSKPIGDLKEPKDKNNDGKDDKDKDTATNKPIEDLKEPKDKNNDGKDDKDKDTTTIKPIEDLKEPKDKNSDGKDDKDKATSTNKPIEDLKEPKDKNNGGKDDKDTATNKPIEDLKEPKDKNNDGKDDKDKDTTTIKPIEDLKEPKDKNDNGKDENNNGKKPTKEEHNENIESITHENKDVDNSNLNKEENTEKPIDKKEEDKPKEEQKENKDSSSTEPNKETPIDNTHKEEPETHESEEKEKSETESKDTKNESSKIESKEEDKIEIDLKDKSNKEDLKED
ncbi:myb-like protein X [Pectinophora gossypiella]|uniref:myb-like protein X n=1 Tax=Pectinophora gossypiella TaxID=13191 RepID=UPI00214DFBE0|nr:myb-like protein X [Pectinophora gossypiella]